MRAGQGLSGAPVPGRPEGVTAVAMSAASFNDFAAEAKAQGFDEVAERHWDPRVVLDTHTHPFAVSALLVRGEMWLTVGGETRHLRAGDTFELERDVPHAERYGVDGATYWAARRHA
jgi:hypothetical protein